MENEQNTQLEENTPEVQNTQEEMQDQQPQVRTFTQEDVNRIVENRLAKERKRLGALFNDPRENEISKKESELFCFRRR